MWIAAVEAEQRPEVAQAAADANYLFFGTHGATLGMNSGYGKRYQRGFLHRNEIIDRLRYKIMRIEHVLQELSRQIALDGVALDENRVCQLVFDDKIVVNIESPLDNEDKVYLYSTVGIVPPENKEVFL